MTLPEPGASSEPEEVPKRGLLLDVSPLTRSAPFARLYLGEAVSAIGAQMTAVASGIQIYEVTQSTLAVSLLGLVALGPMILIGLYGGVLADTFDRRKVALAAAVVAWGATVLIAVCAWTDVTLIWPLYVLVTLNAMASTVVGATRQAIGPRILPRSLLPAAAALVGLSLGLASTVGPALAGFLIGTIGIPWAYTVDALLFVSAFLGIATLPPIRPEGGSERPGLKSVVDGVRFLRSAPNIAMSFIVDIVANVFGQPRALLPAIAALLLGGGAATVGFLTAATAVGAILSGVFSGRFTGIRWQGRAVYVSIIAYGACIAGFGVVLLVQRLVAGDAVPAGPQWPALLVASVFLAGAGASDNIGVIFRGTILQSAAPDGMRGRLQGIFTVVVTGGPRLGDLWVGLVALTAALWLPPLLGGLIIVALLAVLARITVFARYDALAPTP